MISLKAFMQVWLHLNWINHFIDLNFTNEITSPPFKRDHWLTPENREKENYGFHWFEREELIPRGVVRSSEGTSSTLVSVKKWNTPIFCWKEVNCLNYSVLLWLPSLTLMRDNLLTLPQIISLWIQTLIAEWLQQIGT